MAKKPVDNTPNTDEAIDDVQTPETELEENSTRQNEQVESNNAKTELEKVGEAMGINPDDMTQEEKDILAHIFEKRRLHPATKEQKEKLYKNEEKIVSSGEKVKNFELYHGECVALGTVAAAYISWKKEMLSMEEFYEIRDMFVPFYLPISVDDIDPQEILKLTKSDKKMEADKIKFILLKKIGKAVIDRTVTDDEILAAIEEINFSEEDAHE